MPRIGSARRQAAADAAVVLAMFQYNLALAQIDQAVGTPGHLLTRRAPAKAAVPSRNGEVTR